MPLNINNTEATVEEIERDYLKEDFSSGEQTGHETILDLWRWPLLRKYTIISSFLVWVHVLIQICQAQQSSIFQYRRKFHLFDDVIKWKHFPRDWPFVRGIHWSPVNSPHKGQWRGALMFSLICVWINGWVNNRKTGDLRRHRAHYDVIVMFRCLFTFFYYETTRSYPDRGAPCKDIY